MLGNLKRQWRTFHHGKPGHRFQDRFDHTLKARKTQSWARRLIEPIIAVILLAIGVVLTILPGPAVVFFFAGAGLLAGESRTLARGLDWSEVKLRRLFHWCQRWWKKALLPAKAAVIFVAACCASGLAYLAYRILFAK